MANYYCSSVAYAAVAQWAATTGYTVGQIVRQLAAVTFGNERCFRCTTAGTSGGSEPAWNLGSGATTVSGTATFTEVSGVETYHTPGSWLAPFASLLGATGRAGATDIVYVAASHNETTSSSWIMNNSARFVYCVDDSGSGHVPPTSADLRTTAVVTTTGASGMSIVNAFSQCYGINFVCGSSGTVTLGLMAQSSGQPTTGRFDTCTFKLGSGTASGSQITLSSSSQFKKLTWVDCGVNFTNVGHTITCANNGLAFTWRNAPGVPALLGSTPTHLISDSALGSSNLYMFVGLDLSAITLSAFTLSVAAVILAGCKLGAGGTVTGANTPSIVDVVDCDSSAGVVPFRNERWTPLGNVTTVASPYRTGGASDGRSQATWKANVTGTTSYVARSALDCVPISVYNLLTGSRTIAVEVLTNTPTTLPATDTAWLEVEYPASGATPQLSVAKSGPGHLVAGATIAASTAAWVAPARANSTAYAVGQLLQVPGNPFVFMVTSLGTSGSSQPAGYGTATEGGSTFSDGTATVRALARGKLSVTVTIGQEGEIKVTPRLALGVATVLYIDPFVTIT